MGKSSKKNKKSQAGDQLDSSDTDSIGSSSTTMSDSTPVYATDHVTSTDFVLDKLIDSLYEKRGSTRENALVGIIDAFESFVLLPFVEDKCTTLSHLFINSIKKGSAKETILASRAIGLLSLTVGGGSSSHEIMEEALPQLCKILSESDQSKMPAVLDCISLATFVGAIDLAETELALRAMWDVIHPISKSNIVTVKKYGNPVVAAAITAWSFLLTTISTWRISPEHWKEHISRLSTLLESDDRAVRMAAGTAIALLFELRLLDVQVSEEASTAEGEDPKYQLFLYMQGMKAKVKGQIEVLAGEAGGRGADKKNLNDQRMLFGDILAFIKGERNPKQSVKVSGGTVEVSSWSMLIQLNFLRRFLGKGFLKHAQGNSYLHEIFVIAEDKTEGLPKLAKKMYRIEDEKGRDQIISKARRNAQLRKQSFLNEQD